MQKIVPDFMDAVMYHGSTEEKARIYNLISAINACTFDMDKSL